MNTRRIVTTVGIAAGGALAATFLSTAVAAAGPGDDPDFVADPFGLTPTGNADLDAFAGVPPFFETGSGTQTFDFSSDDIAPFLQDILNLPTGDDAITADDVTLNVTDSENIFGQTSQGITLPEDVTLGDTTLDQNSVFDVENFGGGFGNVYADVLGVGTGDNPQTVVDYLVTPFGNFDVSSFVQPFDFDLDTIDPSTGLDFGSGAGDLLGGLF
jgi:hypothetical protein